jgi:hypothetical protein
MQHIINIPLPTHAMNREVIPHFCSIGQPTEELLDRELFPKKWLLANEKKRVDWVITKCKIADVLDFHVRMHPTSTSRDWSNVTLSDDGVPESNATPTSFDCISLKFEG